MSANADVLRSSDLIGSQAQETGEVEVFCATNDWNREDFAREQIRGLVQRVFFASGGRPVTQVVFSAAETHTDVGSICDQVGWALALETSAHIAVVGRASSPITAGAAETLRDDPWCAGRMQSSRRQSNHGLRRRRSTCGACRGSGGVSGARNQGRDAIGRPGWRSCGMNLSMP